MGTNQQLITTAVDTLRDALTKVFTDAMVTESIGSAHLAIETYSVTTLERIINHPWNHQSAAQITYKMDSNVWSETTINDYIAVVAALNLTDGYGIDSTHMNSWHLYTDLHPYDNNGDYPDERLNQFTAIYPIIESMRSRGVHPYVKDDLRGLILRPTDPYQRDDIIHVITTYGAYDVDRIKDILSHTSALRDGVL